MTTEKHRMVSSLCDARAPGVAHDAGRPLFLDLSACIIDDFIAFTASQGWAMKLFMIQPMGTA